MSRQRQKGREIRVGIDCAIDGADQPRLLDELAVLNAVQVGCEEAVLPVQGIVAAGRRLDQRDAAGEIGLGIEQIDDPVDEAAQEIAAAELHDAFGVTLGIGTDLTI